jgi:hypothetical protein
MVSELSGPSAAESETCVCRKRLKALLWGLCPLILVFSVGIQGAWRQPQEGRPLHVLDSVLQGLSANRVSMLHFQTTELIHCPLGEMIPCTVCIFFLSFSIINHYGVQLHASILCLGHQKPDLHL